MDTHLIARTTLVSWHQNAETNLDFMRQEMMGWQWHQLGCKQIICPTLQTNNRASTSSLTFYGPIAVPDAQPAV